MATNEELIERLKKMIEATGEKPTVLARKIGVSQANMSLTLHGKRLVTFDMLAKIADEYPNINPMFVLRGGSHAVLTEDEDFMPLVCRNSDEVLADIMNRYGIFADDFRDYPGLERLGEELCLNENGDMAVLERGFTFDEVFAINNLFPELNLHWVMTHKGSMLDTRYLRLQMEVNKTNRK